MKELASQNFDISLIDSEMNLDNLTFTPNFNPSFSTNDVVMDDIDQTQEKMSDDFQSRIQASEKQDVICPHCGEEFQVAR